MFRRGILGIFPLSIFHPMVPARSWRYQVAMTAKQHGMVRSQAGKLNGVMVVADHSPLA